MAQAEASRKPSWSLDVKLISNLSDLLARAGEISIQLENGDGSQYVELTGILREVYYQLGGDLDHDGNMLNPEVRSQLSKAFAALEEFEKKQAGKKEVALNDFIAIKGILRVIRGLLYVEQNRLFIKFITIWDAATKAERYSHGRAAVVSSPADLQDIPSEEDLDG